MTRSRIDDQYLKGLQNLVAAQKADASGEKEAPHAENKAAEGRVEPKSGKIVLVRAGGR